MVGGIGMYVGTDMLDFTSAMETDGVTAFGDTGAGCCGTLPFGTFDEYRNDFL